MLFWFSLLIFLVRCSSRSTVIFLIVSKVIQKYDQRKFYFFSKEIFSNLVFTFVAEKKIAKKIYNFFSVHQNCKTKKFAISKISNKKFRKIHYFAKIKYKRNSRKYGEKNLRTNIFVKKKKNFAKKNSIIKIFTRKKFVEKNLKTNFCNFFIFKKNSVQIRLIFEKKNFFKFWK